MTKDILQRVKKQGQGRKQSGDLGQTGQNVEIPMTQNVPQAACGAGPREMARIQLVRPPTKRGINGLV